MSLGRIIDFIANQYLQLKGWHCDSSANSLLTLNHRLLINFSKTTCQGRSGGAVTQMENPVLTPRRGRGRPFRGEGANRDELLRIAFDSFAREGFEGSNFRRIAAAAGVDAALLSRYFGPKIELWKAVVDRLSTLIREAQAPIRDLHGRDTPIAERLSSALRLFATLHCDIPELARFFLDAARFPDGRKDYVMQRLWQPNVETMLPLLREASEAGVLAGHNPDLLLLTLVGAAAMPVMLPDLAGPEPPGDVALQIRLGDMLVAMCLRQDRD